MVPRPDLLSRMAPEGVEVFQLTTEDLPSSHVYMEAQIFTPDSKRFVLHRSAHAHGSDKNDPEHQYLVCDLDDGGRLAPITTEVGATAPSVSPDGSTLYYFVNETEVNGGRLILRRVNLDGTGRDTVLVVDAPLPGTRYRPSRIYPLSTISADGARLALSAFLGDGDTEDAPYGLMVFDIAAASVSLILEGPTWLNMHPQYCRSLDAGHLRDVLVQENHGGKFDLTGAITTLVSGDGADIHVVRDDGSQFRNLPWGRDGNEFCQGHQCWRGRSHHAITSTSVRPSGDCELIESPPTDFAGHVGLATPGGRRDVLSRHFPKPRFYHFATDDAGRRFISDARIADGAWLLYIGEFAGGAPEALVRWRYILDTGSAVNEKRNHPHPFLSPDGTTGFFNSDESGVLQAYMVRGLFPA